MNIIDVKDLRCGYDAYPVIKGLDLSVRKGEFVGIVGPNGSGKTTLFKALTKIVTPETGAINLLGKDLSVYSYKELAKKAAVLPQFFEVRFSYTAEEFVLMGRFPHLGRLELPGERDRDIVREVMSETGTHDIRERRINTLSGGELQKVVLAQALAQEPELLLLDEPTSHLDIGHQIEILDLIKKLNKEKSLSIIMIAHDLNLASDYCDRLIMLNEGRIYKSGLPEEVLTYQIIEEVYKTTVVVEKSIISKKPHVFPDTGMRQKQILN